jgi:mannose-6-phosphate isomerase-like protein (cupin superfamily)
MAARFTHMNLTDVEDSAPKFGFSESQEARFSSDELEAEQTGISYQRFKPGKRQAFAHRHDEAEDVYVVLSGSGRMKLDDEIIDLKPLDAIRVSAGVTRNFEAGDDGLEVIAFGPRHKEDRGEIIPDWWTD